MASERPDFSVERQKLIHSGKVLKDGSTVAESGFKENDFLVCMVTKEVPKPAPRAAPAAAATTSTAAPSAAPEAAASAAATDSSTATTNTATAAATASTPAVSTAQATSATPPAPPPVEISEDSVAMLTAMGFPDAEARYALTAARGDGNLAVEFLMNGVPEQLANASAPNTTGAPTSTNSTAPTATTSADGPLAQLRMHPQFTQLQRLVQSNPAALGQVLEAIGQQDADLLATIHANHDAFVAMMNEPIVEQPANPAAGAAPPAMGGMPGAGGMPDINPAQLLQMLAGLTDEQRAQAAASMGMTAEQLQHFTTALNSVPPDQLQNMLGSMGGPGGPGNAQVISLTQEELAAVRRIQDLGFSEQQAVQAFVACDRNETLAANWLFDGGLAFDEDDGGDGGDDMYN